MASFRGALLTISGGSTVIGRGSHRHLIGLGSGGGGGSCNSGQIIPFCVGKPNLTLVKFKPLSTLGCKRFPSLSFKSGGGGGGGKVDSVFSVWRGHHHHSGLQKVYQRPFSTTSSASSSLAELPGCNHGGTRRASESSGYLISSSTSSFRAWERTSSIGSSSFSSKSGGGGGDHHHGLDGSSSSPSTSTVPSSSAKIIDSQANMSTMSSSQLDTQEGVGGIEVIYFRGLPQFTIPLPSRKERCRFIVKPLTNTVADLQAMIRQEDKGVDRIACHSTDGTRIASANTIEMLMEHDFDMIVNDKSYRVLTPPQEKASKEDLERLSSVRNLVGQLYGALNVDEHQLRQEREMLTELEKLQGELVPLEGQREQLNQVAIKRTNTLTWVGLGLMSVQFGILARLTWWEYSWDIMEPVTYFVTYGTAMLAYAYFVLTKQEYVLPDVRDREYLITFHKNAKKMGFDVDKYNKLRDQIYKIETDLHRLRDPLALHLPLKNRLGEGPDSSWGGEMSSQGIVSKIQQIFKKSSSSSSSSSSTSPGGSVPQS